MERWGLNEHNVDLKFISYYCHEVIDVKYGCFSFTLPLLRDNLGL